MKKGILLIVVGLFLIFTGRSAMRVIISTSDDKLIGVGNLLVDLINCFGVSGIVAGILFFIKSKREKTKQ